MLYDADVGFSLILHYPMIMVKNYGYKDVAVGDDPNTGGFIEVHTIESFR